MLLLCHFLADFDSVCFYLIGLGAGFKTSTQNFEINLLCKFMQIYSKSMKNATSLSFLGRFWFCLFYLIGLGAGFKTSTQNFEINLLCKFMQIYSKSMKNATSLSFLGRFWFCLFYLIGLGAGFKTSTQNFEIHYANLFKINEKCYFSVISWPILFLFVLSDRAWCGLQNFYHRILKFINYANLCKFIQNQWKMLLLCHFLGRFWFCLFYLIGLGAGFKTSTQNFEINLLCKFMQIYSKSMKNATSLSFLGRFWFCLFYLIGLWCGLQNFYTEFWNSLCKFIQNQWKMLLLCHFLADFVSVCFIW